MGEEGLDEDGWPQPSPLLPPDDRLWRHPSEVGSRLAHAATTPSAQPRLLVVAVLAGVIGALLGTGLATIINDDDGAERRRFEAVERVGTPVSLLSRATGPVDVAAIASRTASALAHLSVVGRTGTTTGSAVMWRSDGLLLTNQHLVAGARLLRVTLADGRSLAATLVGADEETDVAVLRVRGDGFSVMTLGSAAGLRVGQPAVAVGAPTPMAESSSVTSGIVSALGRRVTRSSGSPLLDMIQFDGAVTPEASGGPLLDEQGTVIGITTAVAGADGGAAVGFATPIDVARLVAMQLVTTGDVSHVWLGVDGQDLDPETAARIGVAGGVLIRDVWGTSPAQAAGLAKGDIVTAVDGKRVRSMTALVVALRSRLPGDEVTIDYRRDGSTRSTKATVAERPRSSRQRS